MFDLLDLAKTSWVHWLGFLLSLVAAAGYFFIASPARPADYLSPPIPVMIAAGVAYLVGGALILLGDGRLLIAGAIVNLLVIAAFVASARQGNATVDALSLIGKGPQVALEVVLLWLIVRRD